MSFRKGGIEPASGLLGPQDGMEMYESVKQIGIREFGRRKQKL